MKKNLLSILFLLISLLIFAEDDGKSGRIYMLKIIAFNTKYEVFCTKKPVGYYKYPQELNKEIVYLTYQGNDFIKKSKWDENLFVVDLFYPTNMWTSPEGKVFRLKKRYGPVIEKNRERKNFPYGFGKN